MYSVFSHYFPGVFSMLMLWIPLSLAAQHDNPLRPVSRTYALIRATIIPSPGKKIDNGTVVIKNGIITGVGKSVVIPPDAIVVPMDSMYVYSGFIDGFSYTGVKPAAVVKREKAKEPGNPDPERAGITPQRDVRDFLDPADRSIAALRSQGFAVVQAVPYGGMLPGEAAIVLLGGGTADDMVLKGNAALCSELVGAGEVYPSTIMGVLAKWRDLYRQAVLVKTYERTYDADPRGRERPRSNELLNAFYPVIDNTRPVLFKAKNVLDVQRVISLHDELGFRLMVVGLQEGWPIIDKIKSAGVGIFLSLNLPEELKKSDDKDSVEVNSEKKALRGRVQQAIENRTGQAWLFSKKGIPFGFTTEGVKDKRIRPNLMRIIKSGLSEDAALAALTTVPARLLGLENRLGTVEVGKIANIMVSDKPYFKKKARVRHMFVDGVKYDIADKKKKTDSKEQAVITGSWLYTVDFIEGKITGTIAINSEDAENYSGTITNSYTGEESELKDFVREDNSISFTFTVNVEDERSQVHVNVSVEVDIFEGTLSVDDESFPMEGTKEPESTL